MIKLYNYKTGKTVEGKTAYSVAKQMGLSDGDRCNLYKLIHGKMVRLGDYCLASNAPKKSYRIVTPQGKTIVVKNWMKLATANHIRTELFKDLLEGRCLMHRGFYLKRNENIIPKIRKRVVSLTLDGKDYEVTNLSGFAKEHGIRKEGLYNLVRGKVSRNRRVRLKAVHYK